jgi:hypothetical protein
VGLSTLLDHVENLINNSQIKINVHALLWMEMPMAPGTPLLTEEQWTNHLQAWAVERWGEARALAIGETIQGTARQLVILAEYALQMEQTPGFFMAEP